MENMIHWGIKMTMYLLQRSDKKLICPFYFSDQTWIPIFLLSLCCGIVHIGWRDRDSCGHNASCCVTARGNGERSCSLELNTHGNCRNVNYKQTPLAKISAQILTQKLFCLCGWNRVNSPKPIFFSSSQISPMAQMFSSLGSSRSSQEKQADFKKAKSPEWRNKQQVRDLAWGTTPFPHLKLCNIQLLPTLQPLDILPLFALAASLGWGAGKPH